MMLQENYESVDKKITEACRRAGRNRDAVTLIAVSKTKPLSDIEELLLKILERTRFRNWSINMNIYPDRSNGI